MSDSYLTGLTGQLNWAEIVALRGEAMAVETGWSGVRSMFREKVGPVGVRAATELPMIPSQRPSERDDTLDTANAQRLRALDAVSKTYTEYMDELIFDREEWDQIVAQGNAQETVDGAYEAIYSRLIADATAIFETCESTTYLSARGADNSAEAIAASDHATLGADEDNVGALSLSAANVATTQTLLANQARIDGTPGFFVPKFLVSSDWGLLYSITKSELASSANNANPASLLQPVHMPGLSTYWALVSRPQPGGLTLEFAAGRAPYVRPPVTDEYGRTKIIFGAKYAFLSAGFGGTYFQKP